MPTASHPLGDYALSGAPQRAELIEAVNDCAGDVGAMLSLAREIGLAAPKPGDGRTAELWDLLASIARTDLTVARAIEPHLDAVAILDQAGDAELAGDGAWGVFAAEGPGPGLRAEQHGDRWRLAGVKQWCSLADQVSHALVSAWISDDQRALFAVDMRQEGVTPLETTWCPTGLSAIVSGPVEFAAIPAQMIGEPGWYLDRPGFAWGGIGVAAIWYGGAVGVADRLLSATKPDSDDVRRLHAGRCDSALFAAGRLLRSIAADIDAGRAAGQDGWRLALRVRDTMHDAAETVLRATDHGLGPGPLTGEPEHAQRVADLRIYIRQHHGERDQIALGALVPRDEKPTD